MAGEQALLSTEIVNRGVEPSGPDAGSPTFSVRVRRRLPDFLQSVNLKYVRLGYHYLLSHGVYLATIPVIVLVCGAEVGSLSRDELWRKVWGEATYDLATVIAFLAVLAFTISVYIMSRPRPVYLIDFACYKPADELKVTILHAILLLHAHAFCSRRSAQCTLARCRCSTIDFSLSKISCFIMHQVLFLYSLTYCLFLKFYLVSVRLLVIMRHTHTKFEM
jgi:hypothetical protein